MRHAATKLRAWRKLSNRCSVRHSTTADRTKGCQTQSPAIIAGSAPVGSLSVLWRPLRACVHPVYEGLTLLRGRSGTASSTSRLIRTCRRRYPRRRLVSDCIVSLSWPSSQLCVAHRASKVFSQHSLKRRIVHHLLRQRLLQLGILGLKRLQLFCVRHFHPAVPRSPFVKLASLTPCLRQSSFAPSPA